MTVSEQIALAAIFYFGQVFVFCRLINQNMLKCFLLIILTEHTLRILYKFLDSYFFNLRRCLLKIFPDSHFWNYIEEKSVRPVLLNMSLVLVLTTCANGLADSFSCKYYVMFIITNLIEWRMGKITLNHFVGNNCPEFCNRFLDSFVFKLTLGCDVWNFVSRQLLSKPSWLSNITKKSATSKPEP